MNHYQDIYKRFHDKPVTKEKPIPTNNAFLFSGYAYLLGLVPNKGQPIIAAFSRSQTEFGYNRHPNEDVLPASSHDEVVGMYMITPMPKLTEKWEKQGWQICNQPGFKPTPWHRINWLKVIKAYLFILYFTSLYKMTKGQKGYKNARHAVLGYPSIWPIAFKHAAQHVYFYKRCMDMSPGIYLSLRFVLASMFTIFFSSNSSKVMLGFKLMKLKKKNAIERFVSWVFKEKVDHKNEVIQYFPEDHPIAIAAKVKL